MSFLNDKEVQKYFRHCQKPECDCRTWYASIAEAVVKAMEAPIKEGDLWLDVHSLGKGPQIADFELNGLHTETLRLPSKFQGERKAPTDWAIEKAAQAWCTQSNCGKVMDIELSMAFARILDQVNGSCKLNEPKAGPVPVTGVRQNVTDTPTQAAYKHAIEKIGNTFKDIDDEMTRRQAGLFTQERCKPHMITGCQRCAPTKAKIDEICAFHDDGHILKETASLHHRILELVRLVNDSWADCV